MTNLVKITRADGGVDGEEKWHQKICFAEQQLGVQLLYGIWGCPEDSRSLEKYRFKKGL